MNEDAIKIQGEAGATVPYEIIPPTGEWFIRITPDGVVHVNPAVPLDDAALAMWREAAPDLLRIAATLAEEKGDE